MRRSLSFGSGNIRAKWVKQLKNDSHIRNFKPQLQVEACSHTLHFNREGYIIAYVKHKDFTETQRNVHFTTGKHTNYSVLMEKKIDKLFQNLNKNFNKTVPFVF